jgi:putative endonuclease
MLDKQYYVYILASKKYGTLYTGITANLAGRIFVHKQKYVDGFTKKYDIDKLVWYEVHADVYEAISREKRIKKWKRQWKINLIERTNPQWLDLYYGLGG